MAVNQAFERARVLIDLRRYADAIPLLYEALGGVQIDRPTVFLTIAECLLMEGKGAEAQQLLEMDVLPHQPDDVYTLHLYGLALLAQKKWTKAKATFRDSIAREPAEAEGYKLLAMVYLYRREYEKAWALIQQAVALDPADEDVAIMRLNILADWPFNKVPTWFQIAPDWPQLLASTLALAPNSAYVHLYAGEMYWKESLMSDDRSNVSQVEQHYLSALRLDPRLQPNVALAMNHVLVGHTPIYRLASLLLAPPVKPSWVRTTWQFLLVGGWFWLTGYIADKGGYTWLERLLLTGSILFLVLIGYHICRIQAESTPLGRHLFTHVEKRRNRWLLFVSIFLWLVSVVALFSRHGWPAL